MAVAIPHGVKAGLTRRTKPVGRREAGDVGAAAAEEAGSTARPLDMLGQHLEPDEKVRNVSASSGHKTSRTDGPSRVPRGSAHQGLTERVGTGGRAALRIAHPRALAGSGGRERAGG